MAGGGEKRKEALLYGFWHLWRREQGKRTYRHFIIWGKNWHGSQGRDGRDRPSFTCGHGAEEEGDQSGGSVKCYIFMSNERTEWNKHVKEKLAKTWLNQIKGFPDCWDICCVFDCLFAFYWSINIESHNCFNPPPASNFACLNFQDWMNYDWEKVLDYDYDILCTQNPESTQWSLNMQILTSDSGVPAPGPGGVRPRSTGQLVSLPKMQEKKQDTEVQVQVWRRQEPHLIQTRALTSHCWHYTSWQRSVQSGDQKLFDTRHRISQGRRGMREHCDSFRDVTPSRADQVRMWGITRYISPSPAVSGSGCKLWWGHEAADA